MNEVKKIIYNDFQTKLLKTFLPNESTFIEVYNYEDYTIIFDIQSGSYLKHISVNRGLNQKMNRQVLELIAEHFLGKNYEIVKNPIAPNNIINIDV
ncbi:MAG: hypothetical protein CR959_01545, partial [Fusobacteriales bacterium]